MKRDIRKRAPGWRWLGGGILLLLSAGAAASEVGMSGGKTTAVSSETVQEVAVDSSGEKPGLAKVLTNRYPRRADIPDAFLVIMLALIGIVVISRRDVTAKEGSEAPKRIDK